MLSPNTRVDSIQVEMDMCIGRIYEINISQNNIDLINFVFVFYGFLLMFVYHLLLPVTTMNVYSGRPRSRSYREQYSTGAR